MFMLDEARDSRRRDRMPQSEWDATIARVRGEFAEMPCMRLTPDMARTLFGLPQTAVEALLQRLEAEGFLSRTDQGEYVRRSTPP
jgi:hypothetical protein